MRIRFLGTHNAESRDTHMVSLLVDGVIALDTGSMPAQLSFSEQARIKAILLSHGHYDHIRGVPAFAFNNLGNTTRVFAMAETLEILSSHLVDGLIYPRFNQKTAFLDKPALEFVPLEPLMAQDVEGYQVRAVPVNHRCGAAGFEISKDGRQLFYTGDTGPGLSAVWEQVSPQLLICDLTFPDGMEKAARDSGHLCPGMLKAELAAFHDRKGYLPQVFAIHLSARHKDQIEKQVAQAAAELGASICIAREGEEAVV